MLTDFPAKESTVSDRVMRDLQASVIQEKPQLAVAPAHPFDELYRPPRREVVRAALLSAEQARKPWTLVPWLLGAGAVIAGLLFVSQYGLKVKSRVVQQGSAAIGSLLAAKSDLESFNFDGATSNLKRSSTQFSDASHELDALGPSFVNFIGHIPGLSSLRVGRDVLKAGALLSDAGLALSEAVDTTTRTGGLLDPKNTSNLSRDSIFVPLQASLTKAQGNVTEATRLLKNVDAASLPEEYRGQFIDLQGRLPVVQSLVDRAVSVASFLGRMTGTDRPRRYLILFSNPSELRPTGGFPGSYGIITFENGRVKDFRADDIYNPDGQIRDLIIPPLQLQHITPGWGMRDVAWWIDFPTSAKKVMEYWQHDGGAAVDGVFAIKPDVLEGILKITGPISMPQYDLVLTSQNVVATLQLEVESKKTAQPKQIIVDLAPLILQRLSSVPTPQWVALLGLFKESLDERDALMYFDDQQLQFYVLAEGFSGAVRATPGDYLMVDVSNIKGAKADAVTDTSVKLESWTEDGTMIHRLTLTRRHNGGSTDYGFYNKPNNSWVRVLVPKGSVVRGIKGNATPVYKPLMDYSKVTARRDTDLQALESTYRTDARGVLTYEESGKTGFGFWMSLAPNSTEVVQVEYSVPAQYISQEYSLLVQRQPGLDLTDFELTIQKGSVKSISASEPALVAWPDSWRLHTDLAHDLEFRASLK